MAKGAQGNEGFAVADVAEVQKVKTVRIIIDETRDSTEMQNVPVGVNGRMWIIKRGEEVEVPLEVLEVLDHAVVEKTVKLEGGAEVTKKVKRFNYSVLSGR